MTSPPTAKLAEKSSHLPYRYCVLPAAAVQAVQLDWLPPLHVGGGPACSTSAAGHVRCSPALQPRSPRPVGHTAPPLSASAILRECVEPSHGPKSH